MSFPCCGDAKRRWEGSRRGRTGESGKGGVVCPVVLRAFVPSPEAGARVRCLANSAITPGQLWKRNKLCMFHSTVFGKHNELSMLWSIAFSHLKLVCLYTLCNKTRVVRNPGTCLLRWPVLSPFGAKMHWVMLLDRETHLEFDGALFFLDWLFAFIKEGPQIWVKLKSRFWGSKNRILQKRSKDTWFSKTDSSVISGIMKHFS